MFLILEIISLSMLFTYNKFHQAIFMGASSEVTGKIFTQYSRIHDYFHLKQENDILAAQNLALIQQLHGNFYTTDTTHHLIRDSIPEDTLGHFRKFTWMGADVINNTISFPDNYITLDKGSDAGVRKDMGVIGPNGVVGTVVNVSAHVSVVMSLLHKQSRVSGMLLKTRDAGRIEWDGSDPNILTMRDIPRSVPVRKGDTVVTGTYSERFPSGIVIGTVSSIENDPASNFYVLRLLSSTNFGRLQHVYLVDNRFIEEQNDLENETRKMFK